MKLTKNEWLHTGRWIGQWLIVMGLMGMALGCVANAQGVSTTTVQGTVYLANGQAGAGTLDVSWPGFTTSNSQAITAGRVTVTIGQDGFVSVNLAPNLGATPAGLYYTAIYHLSDGTTSTEYWVVPASAQASLGQVRAQLMPSSQAVQAVSKAYVDQSITELTQSLLTASGGTLSGPLYLNGDPTQAVQAADKHYVDSAFGLAVPLAGGSMTGALATPAVNGVQAPVAGSTQTTIQAAVSAAGTNGAVEIPPTYTGSDGFTNTNGVHVTDLRQKGAQQSERSVKEFGAVCDGMTDDTNALQTALNYALAHGVALTIPQGTCKTHMLTWRGESIGGMGKQVSALMGYPGQDVLATATDSTNLLANTRLHDLTIYVDQSMDVSCSAAEVRAPAGSCAMSRLLESNSIFSPGGNGLTGTAGTGTAWAVGNCAIAMPAATGTSGNGLRLAEIANLEITAIGVDPMAQYTGAHSTHTCGLYLAQWPQWSEFHNIDIRGLNTGIAMPALPGITPAGLNADSNRWQNITIQATHGFTAAAGSNNVLDNVVVVAGNSAATGEPPTGLVLDLTGTQQGWTVRNAVVLPAWNVVTPTLTVTAAGGTVTAVTVGTEKGLGFDPYGTTVPLKFSGSCTAAAAANVKSDGSIGTISVTQGGVGCSGTTTASVNVDGTWDTAAPVNLIAGQNMTLLGGNLQKSNGGYTVWNASGSRSSGTLLGGSGGTLPGGGSYAGLVANNSLGTASQVDQFPGTDFGAKLQACLGSISATYGGTCDARNFTGNLSMASNLTVSTANVTVLLPCATISTAAQVIVTSGTRNVALRGCALRGASTASGSQGGTVFLYSGTGAMVLVGDPTYAADTMGFHLDNVVINTTASSSVTAQGLTAYRTQELDLESLYFLGNQNQTGMTLDGTGNYTGGTFFDDAFNGFQTAVNAIGHQTSNAATTDWMNASAFVRLHIDCPTSAGNPISGTYGINLQQGDGNTFTGGDVESCSTALHLGANAQNNTIIGLRNENSTNQVVADAGSSYNNWMTGGTMFTGQLTDNGTRNSFMDTFHRSFNGIKGDWYGSQQDATVTNHYRIGIGAGNERGLLNRYQTDYGYRWTTGLSDATAGEQFFQVLDELNNVNRLSIGQYNNGQSSTNNQTVINAAGTGAIVLNGSNNAGTGGVIIGSGGASESTVATINNAGNAQFNGTLQVGGPSTFIGTTTIKNQADAEIDQILWAGATANQKESYVYKDYAGSSQWYMVKDSNNNWALNSATGGLDSFKAYQSGNSGDTYINTSNSSGVVRLNYESGSSGKTYIYGGSSSSLIAAFSGTTAIAFPGLKSSSGYNCLQIDNSGYISNTGAACGTGSGGTNGTVSSANAGQIAYYAANGTALSGMSAVPVTAGGTGAATAAGALAALGAQAAVPGLTSDGMINPGIQVTGTVAAGASVKGPILDDGGSVFNVKYFGATPDLQVAGHSYGTYTNVTLVSGSPVITINNGVGAFNCTTDVGKYVTFFDETAAPLATAPYVAKIVSCQSSTQVTLDQNAANSTTSFIYWGTDVEPALAACSRAAFTSATSATYNSSSASAICQIPPGNYLVATYPYYITAGAQDDGSYSTSYGGSGASITPQVANPCATPGLSYACGSITGWTINNGGSGYTPNSSLQVSFAGGCGALVWTGGPCGWAYALANTNSSGVVTSVSTIYSGYGMSSIPAVTVKQLGGDGAAATATITGGAMNTPTVTAGGGGYQASSNLEWWALGGGCTVTSTIHGTPIVGYGTVPVTSGGVVSGTMTVTSNATGCTSAPTIAFGDVVCNSGTASAPVWGQCSNLAPLVPQKIPVAVVSTWGVGFTGIGTFNSAGANLVGVWDGSVANINQPAIYGGTVNSSDLTNISFSDSFWGILAINNVNHSVWTNLLFGGVVGDAIGIYTGSTDIGFVVNNLSFSAAAGWVNGGTWGHRSDYSLGAGGFFDAPSISNVLMNRGVYNSIDAAIDNVFANYFWHPEFSGASVDFAETCKFPQTLNQRQTSGSLSGAIQQANGMCYPGITGTALSILERDSRHTGGGTIDSITQKGGFRSVLCCDAGSMSIYNATQEAGTPIAGSGDPYRNALTLEGGVAKLTDTGFGSWGGGQPYFVNPSWTGTTAPLYCLFSIGQQGVPANTQWRNLGLCSAVNAESAANYNFQGVQTFTGGLLLKPPAGSNTNATVNLYSNVGNTLTPEGQIAASMHGISLNGADFSTQLAQFAIGGDVLTQKVYIPYSAPALGSTNPNCMQQSNSSISIQDGAVSTDGLPCGTITAVAAGSGLTGGATSGTATLACATAAAGTAGCMKPDNSTITCVGGVCSATTSAGTISGVTAGTGLTGGGTSGTVTLNCATAASGTPGCMQPDNSTITCAGGVCSAAVSGAGFLNTTGGQTITTGDTLSGLPAGCLQLPCLVAKTTPATYSGTTGQSLATYTTTTKALYRICGFVDVSVVGTAGTAYMQLTTYYTDGHSFTDNFISGVNLTTLWAYGQVCHEWVLDTGGTVNTYLGFTGATGTPTVNYSVTIEKMTP